MSPYSHDMGLINIHGKKDLVTALHLCFIKQNGISASGTNQGAIDNRIEQAMDLVKSHLMNAVRSEVEELKEKIIKLEETISDQQNALTKAHSDFNREVTKLQSENEFLRGHVAPEVNAQWIAQQQQQQQPPQPQQPSQPSQPLQQLQAQQPQPQQQQPPQQVQQQQVQQNQQQNQQPPQQNNAQNQQNQQNQNQQQPQNQQNQQPPQNH